ncbi:MAG TPA: alginate export family protein, partial [Nitrospiria bacterium]|nr:alginate export family protein [Nitrospiria bacterium]
GNSKSDLGQEIDLVAYTIVKEKLRLEAGYGHFFRGDYVKVNFPTTNHDSDFGYLQAGIGF